MNEHPVSWANQDAVNWAWKQHIPAHPKLLLLAIASEGNEMGQYPSSEASIETLAERCALSLASVRRHLTWLERREFLTVSEGRIWLPMEASQ